ncbi:DUF4376 domain-containing protein [Leptothrix discophora]|uniref:DUF4376 domain-containing protein n=2 Tax=Leptothrix discophora TaxID=89 RepID=A0ABT9G0E1_LEPDI|nr:DUF4376 domain-containing protein [Leptothrix discophora]
MQAQENESILQSDIGDGSTHYVSDGQLIELPIKPNAYSVFDFQQQTWIDPRTLLEVQLAKWEEIKVSRSVEIDTTMSTPYGPFQCRAEDRQNITDSILLAQTLTAMSQPVAIQWTLADNSVTTLDAAQMVTVGLLLGQKVQAAHAKARVLRTAIEAATTIAEVEAISW